MQKTEVRDGKLVIEGLASDQSQVAEVAYKLGDQWRGALPVDGLFDTQYEQFRVTLPLKDGAATTQIRVRDSAGNTKTADVTWPLPAAAEPAKEAPKPRK